MFVLYRILIFFPLVMINIELLFSQSFSLKGQLWLSGLYGDDVPSEISSLESHIGYIPTLSFFNDLDYS